MKSTPFLVLSAALVACGPSTTATLSSGDSQQGSAALVAATRPTLRVGTEGLYPPYDFCGTVEAPVTCASPADLQGFDIDVAKKTCELIGYDCVFVLNDWNSMFRNLKQGRYDAVYSAVGWTAERARKGRYTITYEPIDSSDGAKFYTTTANASLTFTAAGLAGVTIGVQAGTLHEDYARTNFAQSTIVTFDTQSELQNALLSGAVVTVLTNRDVMVPFLAAHPEVVESAGPAIVYGEGGFQTGNIYALVAEKFPADPLLLEKINNAILKMQVSGFIAQRHAYWVH